MKSVVYVLAPDRQSLMPCSCVVARLLLKEGKAKVLRKTPFTIKLLEGPETSYALWQQYAPLLKQHYWKERTLWSDGYFCCTVGNTSQEIIRHYSETQG